MGSSFFRPSLDPIGAILGKIAGPNSAFAEFAHSAPAQGVLKATDPSAYALGQQYGNRANPPAGYVAPATPAAGMAPSLGTAAGGYTPGAMAAANAAVSAANQRVSTPTYTTNTPPAAAGAVQQNPQAYVRAAGALQQNGWGG